MAVRCELRSPSLGITVRHHSASLVIPNSYPHDGIFNTHLTSVKDSYILPWVVPSSGFSLDTEKVLRKTRTDFLRYIHVGHLNFTNDQAQLVVNSNST